MLAPVRFDTSMAIAGLPLKRVIDVGSVKVERTVATSRALHHRIRPRRDRQVGDVLDVFDERRHLDGVAPFPALQHAGGDEAVVAAHRTDQLVELEAVGIELHRVDDHLDEIVGASLEIGIQDAWRLFDAVAQVPRGIDQHPLRRIACERDDEHRELGEVDLVDHRLVGVLRQVALGVGDLGAHILERTIAG